MGRVEPLPSMNVQAYGGDALLWAKEVGN